MYSTAFRPWSSAVMRGSVRPSARAAKHSGQGTGKTDSQDVQVQESRVRSQQPVQARGAGASQPDHDHRVGNLALENLGMTREQILRVQAVFQQAQDVGAIHKAANRVQVGFLLQSQ